MPSKAEMGKSAQGSQSASAGFISVAEAKAIAISTDAAALL